MYVLINEHVTLLSPVIDTLVSTQLLTMLGEIVWHIIKYKVNMEGA